jgi:hypothetical protein
MTIHEADQIPWHPFHIYRAVDERGDYYRFTHYPDIAPNMRTWLSSSTSGTFGDLICRVDQPGDAWSTSLSHKDDISRTPD